MNKIAIPNFKGGTGNTATAVNLSHALALKRQNNRIFTKNSQKKYTLFHLPRKRIWTKERNSQLTGPTNVINYNYVPSSRQQEVLYQVEYLPK